MKMTSSEVMLKTKWRPYVLCASAMICVQYSCTHVLARTYSLLGSQSSYFDRRTVKYVRELSPYRVPIPYSQLASFAPLVNCIQHVNICIADAHCVQRTSQIFLEAVKVIF